MLDSEELTEAERVQIRINILEKKKEQLTAELEDLKYKQKGFKNGKKGLEALGNYFKN